MHLKRVAVVRRAAFDDVCDIAVVPPEVDDAQHIVQQLSGWTDKRLAGQILLLTRTLADEENLRVRGSDAEYNVVPRLAQGTHRTLQAHCPQLFPAHGDLPFCVYSSRSSR